MAASWLVSCLLHGGLAVAAMFFVQRMQLAPQTEPFQWNVALVASLSPPTESPSPTASIVPSQSPLRQPVQPATRTSPPVRPIQPSMTTSVTAPPLEPITEFTPEPLPTQPLLTESQSLTSSLPADSPPQTASQRLSPPSLESQVTTDPPLPFASAANAPTASTDHLKPAKADYGWLTELMAQWIEDLNKRYPATLRTEGVQGKVTLIAMLHEDGLLSDVRVVKSSGNTALDEVALEDVRNGPLIALSRPLERAKIPVKFSISYDLKDAR